MRLIILSLTLLCAVNTLAMPADEFKNFVISQQESCPKLQCPGNQIKLADLPPEEILEFTNEAKEKFLLTGQQFAEEVWQHTILTGPYRNQFQVELRRVQAILLAGERIGFRITYADRAINLNTCQFSENAPEYLANCQTGYIIESAFVSMDLGTTFIDKNNTAKFVPYKY